MISQNAKKTVMHIITGLNNGGAEGVLFRLCETDFVYEHIVVSLMSGGKYSKLLEDKGIKVFHLNARRGRFSLFGFFSLLRLIKKYKPEIVQTWMYHADLIGGVAAKLAGVKKIFWNVRHSNLDRNFNKMSTLLIVRVCALLSYLIPAKIVCCAASAIDVHYKFGYSRKKFCVIPNGYKIDSFSPDRKSRAAIREKLNIPHDALFFGMVARFDPMKDHSNFLKASGVFSKNYSNFFCALIGDGVDESNKEIQELIDVNLLNSKVLLLGRQEDIPSIMNALDFHVLSSAGEAFPNVVAEAMACGTPCIVTDVGDAKDIVGNTGLIVPARDSEALASAMSLFAEEVKDSSTWHKRNAEARARIVEHYSMPKMIDSYHFTWTAS